MSAYSSSAKIWGWAVTQKRCLNGSTIPTQGPTPGANLAAMGQNQLALSVRQCFIKASPTVEKVVSCYKADQLVASLLSFCSVQSLLAVHEFQRKNAANEAAGGYVWTFEAWCRGAQSTWEQLQLCELSGPTFEFTAQEFSMVVVIQRTLKSHKLSKLGGGHLCRYGCLPRTIWYVVGCNWSNPMIRKLYVLCCMLSNI